MERAQFDPPGEYRDPGRGHLLAYVEAGGTGMQPRFGGGDAERTRVGAAIDEDLAAQQAYQPLAGVEGQVHGAVGVQGQQAAVGQGQAALFADAGALVGQPVAQRLGLPGGEPQRGAAEDQGEVLDRAPPVQPALAAEGRQGQRRRQSAEALQQALGALPGMGVLWAALPPLGARLARVVGAAAVLQAHQPLGGLVEDRRGNPAFARGIHSISSRHWRKACCM